MTTTTKYQANFLWPHDDGSIEQAGYEFANAKTQEYQRQWWGELMARLENLTQRNEVLEEAAQKAESLIGRNYGRNFPCIASECANAIRQLKDTQ